MFRSRDDKRTLCVALVVALFASIIITVAVGGTGDPVSAAPNAGASGHEFTTASGEQVRVHADGTYQIAPAGGTFGVRERSSSQVKLAGGTLQTDELSAADAQAIAGRSASFGDAAPGAASDVTNAYIVQFVTQPIEAYRAELRSLGAKVHAYIPDHAHIVRMPASTLPAVEVLPFVNWVGPLLPVYKIDPGLWATAKQDPERTAVYSIQLVDKDAAMLAEAVASIGATGGQIELIGELGNRLEATLNAAQLEALLARNEIVYVDLRSTPEGDIDIVRETGGADFLESVRGYNGSGVTISMFDDALYMPHPEFAANPPTVITENEWLNDDGSIRRHGTYVLGSLVASGVRDGWRGIVPEADLVFASYFADDFNRQTMTRDLVDPNGPYRSVVHVNAWGGLVTPNYTTESAAIDDLLFTYDLLTVQSQSNQGTQRSRPEAWAKNVVSVGGVYHQDSSDPADDKWFVARYNSAGELRPPASIGPAADGRIKPDLVYYFDEIATTRAPFAREPDAEGVYRFDGEGYQTYGGTSASTPAVAGYFALLFEMWADGVFDNEPGFLGGNRDVFANRPKMATAKALGINTAIEYAFEGTSADLTRTHQGWGRIDADTAYRMATAGDIPLIVDEEIVLGEFGTQSYTLDMGAGGDAACGLRATLVYTDPAAAPLSAIHRVNDLSLRLVAPDGSIYWGNNGLHEGNFSLPGGQRNRLDTVENVFIEDAAAGDWELTVSVDELNQDGHPETAELDADFSLVVSGNCIDDVSDGIDVGPGQQPFNDETNDVPGRIQAEDFDIGIAGIAYSDVDEVNIGNAYRFDGVDVYNTYAQPGSYTVGRTRGGEFTSYTLDVLETDDYRITLRVASGFDDPGSITVSLDGEEFATLDINNTGGWWSWQSRSQGGLRMTEGRHEVQLRWNGSGEINLDWFEISVDEGGEIPTAICRGLSQEAEDGALVGNVAAARGTGSLGVGYVTAPLGSGNIYVFNDANYAEYCVQVPEAGDYVIEASVLAVNSQQDSFFLQVDDGDIEIWDLPKSTSWTTTNVKTRGVNPVVLSLDAGEHRLRFYQREDRAKLDKFELVAQ